MGGGERSRCVSVPWPAVVGLAKNKDRKQDEKKGECSHRRRAASHTRVRIYLGTCVSATVCWGRPGAIPGPPILCCLRALWCCQYC